MQYDQRQPGEVDAKVYGKESCEVRLVEADVMDQHANPRIWALAYESEDLERTMAIGEGEMWEKYCFKENLEEEYRMRVQGREVN
ncbi:hypothetical protein TREES_T100005471 [Tupaia chinensis]|uniref:Uncharacterized protein n=1 Tax=Tupaia chinensis TaxID=246437 RepID=L9KJU0_TUPCH|nr:hypothetical protein TREES_T100005471 [Tupaia chinensis]